MKVTIVIDVISGSTGTHRQGESPEIPDDEATRWVAAGWAAKVAPEAAALADPPENAALPKASKRGAG